jgi:hypothetical protein
MHKRVLRNATAITQQLRCKSTDKITPKSGNVNQSLINVLQTAQRRVGALTTQPKKFEKSLVLKDISYIVKKETRGM